jgi:hypothetical protein
MILASLVVPAQIVAAETDIETEDGPRTFTIEFSGKLIKIKSDVENNTTGVLTFAFIVQIKDSDGITVQLSWMDGIKVAPRDKIEAMQSWIPEKPGEYLIEIFVWESIADPDPMSPVRKAIAIVE